MKFRDSRHKKSFIENFPISSLESHDIRSRCKFNFSFFDDTQKEAASFSDLSEGSLVILMDKIRAYSREPLNFWRNERCGSASLKVLADYGNFPAKSDFTHPKSVPHDVNWARFRLENMVRLIGFTIPGEMNFTLLDKNGFTFDKNTFYVVFIDLEHKFYRTKENL
ncbi:hypothetical protein ACL9RJ_16690 [Pseudomonas sp. Mn2068]|uniref:hypothetical protein n=1 Tax=Pseudomonas sp. Mn2068 TaxID=3395265 RepID=UPI003BE43AA1